MDKLKNKTYKTGIQATTEIHNGGTIFGIGFRQVLTFNNELETTLSYEIVFEKGSSESWRESKKKKYNGLCTSNEKHNKISFSNSEDKVVIDFYFNEIGDEFLLCETYSYTSTDPNYKQRESVVFSLEK